MNHAYTYSNEIFYDLTNCGITECKPTFTPLYYFTINVFMDSMFSGPKS